jgi:hypothetical protein
MINIQNKLVGIIVVTAFLFVPTYGFNLDYLTSSLSDFNNFIATNTNQHYETETNGELGEFNYEFFLQEPTILELNQVDIDSNTHHIGIRLVPIIIAPQDTTEEEAKQISQSYIFKIEEALNKPIDYLNKDETAKAMELRMYEITEFISNLSIKSDIFFISEVFITRPTIVETYNLTQLQQGYEGYVWDVVTP